MATRKELLAGITDVGHGFSRMGQAMMERERYDTQKALQEEEAERQRQLFPTVKTTAESQATVAKTAASEALVQADKRKGVDESFRALEAENAAAGWVVDPEDQGSVKDWKTELIQHNRILNREGKAALSVPAFVQLKKDEKLTRTSAAGEEKRKGEKHTSDLDTDKYQRRLLGAQAEKATREANAPLKASELPVDVKSEVTALSGKNAGKVSIGNQIESYLTEFRSAETADDKVRIGRQMLKVLNSPEGADAIGVEEAKRLGDALEYNLFDVGAGLGMKTGKLHGRDLGGFEKQAQSTLDAIRGSVKANRDEVGRLLGRPAAATPAGGGAGDQVGPVQVKDEAGYNALASGTEYIDPSGKRRRKK